MFSIIEKADFDWIIFLLGLPFLKLEEKNPEEIIFLMKKSSQLMLSKSILRFAKLEKRKSEEVLSLMEKSGYDSLICQTGIPFVDFEGKSRKEIDFLLEKAELNGRTKFWLNKSIRD